MLDHFKKEEESIEYVDKQQQLKQQLQQQQQQKLSTSKQHYQAKQQQQHRRQSSHKEEQEETKQPSSTQLEQTKVSFKEKVFFVFAGLTRLAASVDTSFVMLSTLLRLNETYPSSGIFNASSVWTSAVFSLVTSGSRSFFASTD